MRLVDHVGVGMDHELEAGGCYCLGPRDLVHAVPPEALVEEGHLLPERDSPGFVAALELGLVGGR